MMGSEATALSRLRVYLRAHLNESLRIESLAERTLEQLRTDASTSSIDNSLQQLRLIAARVLETDEEAMRSVAVPDDALGTARECSLDVKLHRQLARALLELPPEHARLFLAHKQGLSCEQISERFAISGLLVTVYLSQAHALVRMSKWTPDAHGEGYPRDEYQRTLLIAHQAADWLIRFSEAGPVDHLEFLRWLRQDVSHVREALIALAWADALDALPAFSATR